MHTHTHTHFEGCSYISTGQKPPIYHIKVNQKNAQCSRRCVACQLITVDVLHINEIIIPLKCICAPHTRTHYCQDAIIQDLLKTFAIFHDFSAVISIHCTLILFPSSEGKRHKEKGVKPFHNRQELF